MRRKNWLMLSLFISFLFLFLSYIPNFYEASIADLLPSDRVMTPAEHMYTYDYNVYLSKIKQGIEGGWRVVDKYDNNTNQKGVFLQMLYLLAGKVGGVLRLSPGLTFHLLRTILSSVWVLIIIYLNFYFIKKSAWAFLGVLLSFFAASFPVFYQYQGTTWVGMHMSWWQELDVLKRISYIPHYTLNYIIIAILTLLLSTYSNNFQFSIFNFQSIFKLINFKFNKNFNPSIPLRIDTEQSRSIKFQISNFKIICLILFFSFFIHPSAGLLFLFSWCFYHLISTILLRSYQDTQILRVVIYTLILIIVAAIPLLYFRYVTSSYPWKSLTDFDKLYRYPVNVKDYILTLGPVFFTGILGLILVLIKKEQKLLSLVSWILAAFIAIFIFKKFPYQSELRFVQTANHIPLAILSVYFLFTIKQLILNGWQNWKGSRQRAVEGNRIRSEHWREGKFWQAPLNIIINIFIYGVTFSIIILGIVQSFFSIRSQNDFIHQRMIAGQPLVPYPPQVMYPLKDMHNAFIWLEKNTKNEAVVLSHIYAGNYIPAYSGNFVYLGHNPETPHFDERVRKLETFYSASLSNNEAEKFLKEEKISYVLYGPQEKVKPRTESVELSGTGEKSVEDIKKYPFLKESFTSYHVTLYKVD